MNVFRLIAVAVLMLIPISAGWFLLNEWQRSALVEKYSHMSKAISLPNRVGVWSTSSLLENEEELVCAMDSYGGAEDLKALNARQKKTLSKTDLPSESGAWYLLFFTADQVNRIALFDYSRHHLNQISISCGDKSSTFSMSIANGSDRRRYRFFIFGPVPGVK